MLVEVAKWLYGIYSFYLSLSKFLLFNIEYAINHNKIGTLRQTIVVKSQAKINSNDYLYHSPLKKEILKIDEN